MNFKKLQAMQAKLDEAILKEKAQMTAEERFNKTLVALSVEIAEIANTVEHFKFWKDNKGKVDEKRFRKMDYGKHGIAYEDWGGGAKMAIVDFAEAHRLTLIEECSDALHFILSLANQIGCEIDSHYNEFEEGESKESIFLNLVFQVSVLQKYDKTDFDNSDKVTVQVIVNQYFQYIESLDITTAELEQAYYDKNKINYERLENGY